MKRNAKLTAINPRAEVAQGSLHHIYNFRNVALNTIDLGGKVNVTTCSPTRSTRRSLWFHGDQYRDASATRLAGGAEGFATV